MRPEFRLGHDDRRGFQPGSQGLVDDLVIEAIRDAAREELTHARVRGFERAFADSRLMAVALGLEAL